SQLRAARAIAEGRFAAQLIPVEAPVLDADGKRTDKTKTVTADEIPRKTSLEALAGLKPVARPDGVHTAGSSSQIADGAAAVLLMSGERARALGLKPLARVVETALVGCDPVLMLEGPIPATRRLLKRAGLSIHDIDVVEINEAFASVVLAWAKEIGPDMARVNPNGGGKDLAALLAARRRVSRYRVLSHHQGRPRTPAVAGPLRADHDVLRGRPRDGHLDRARLTEDTPDGDRRCVRHRRAATVRHAENLYLRGRPYPGTRGTGL